MNKLSNVEDKLYYPVQFFNKQYGTIVISCRREILFLKMDNMWNFTCKRFIK